MYIFAHNTFQLRVSAYSPYFEKVKAHLRVHHSVSVCLCIPNINFCMANQSL
jgi:hypothetical protein